MSSILVVASHPDDEVLGCGATVAKHVHNGDTVYRLLMGGGLRSRNPDIELSCLSQLHSSALEAGNILGFKESVFLDFPDNAMDTLPRLEIVREIEKVLDRYKPDTIYTHHRHDLNIDHQITFSAVLTAARPLKGSSVRNILSFEVPSSTEWQPSSSGSEQFMPNYFTDISQFLDKKLLALKPMIQRCETGLIHVPTRILSTLLK